MLESKNSSLRHGVAFPNNESDTVECNILIKWHELNFVGRA
jgi:hypothetical protein